LLFVTGTPPAKRERKRAQQGENPSRGRRPTDAAPAAFVVATDIDVTAPDVFADELRWRLGLCLGV